MSATVRRLGRCSAAANGRTRRVRRAPAPTPPTDPSGAGCATPWRYACTGVSCPDMLWDAPEIHLARGGLRCFMTPSLDVASLTWVHTEADDISGATKPCFKIPGPDPVEVRCDAVGVCLETGILTQRHFPELVNWCLRNPMVAHEIRIRQELFNRAVATATPVTVPATMAALSAVYGAVALQAADMIERHSPCDRISLEVVFPWWAKNLFLADLARQNGVNACDLNPNRIQDLFGTLGVRVQFARGLALVRREICEMTSRQSPPNTGRFRSSSEDSFRPPEPTHVERRSASRRSGSAHRSWKRRC
ncbi:major capsid protein [Nonomuraea sp. 10N515B]|uniref:major capsid protein n=1 Tax=Nonomuraea sp. 10N515B TaxID=3457422 RepID=UPI003FCE8AFE